MARQKRDNTATPIESIKHEDKRTNIPTEELRDFVDEDEKAPEPILYPRDPSLDPQLVWKGKDEQDSNDLEVESVPIYIQEKIQPQAIIEDIRATPRDESNQLDFFSDFNGLEFKDMINFYQHEQNWTNRMILGDSLLVMNSLAEKERLKGQVQMIYIDPPYGIKFGSNWQVSTRKRDVKDGKVEDVTRQPEQIKAFRDTWELGIHSYLSYLRDRLTVARELLTESGSIFVQIGDENVHLVRCLMDEVFGSENFVGEIVFKTQGTSKRKHLSLLNDFILWYAKDQEQLKFHALFLAKERTERFSKAELPNGKIISASSKENFSERTRVFEGNSLRGTAAPGQPFVFRNRKYKPSSGKGWSVTIDGLSRLAKADRIIPLQTTLNYKLYFSDFSYTELGNLWIEHLHEQNKSYVVQTNQKVIERCILMTTDPGDLVLDPTCGSGTTAYVAEEWGRRWITIDTSRVALALARTRLMSARYPDYCLKEVGDIKKGFHYKTASHIKKSDIANNPEIDDIHAKWQQHLEPIRAEINSLADESWEEWEVPHLESTNHSSIDESANYGGSIENSIEEPAVERFIMDKIKNANEAMKCQAAIEKWWKLRRERQEEIDAAIARHSEGEILYDQPFEDKKRLRITGRFTIESLSPHRVLSSDAGTNDRLPQLESLPFETMIIENLKKAGVQNTVKEERLKFDWIEPYAGEWIHAEGEYVENGEAKRAAFSIGPEHGTVGPELIKEAAKEAVQGVGFDLLIVCGFAFDPHVSEERTRYGKLTVLSARMNIDLTMGDEVLKKTGTGNLFMVFGEPDVEIETQPNGKVVVEVKGVDVYDPTTGLVRSNSTDDMACWFIDTNYNGESFFVRHAYFTGEDKPYDNLKRALRAEIDEAAWGTLYRTRSRPFDKPLTGEIAVKVINHYGDEVLKVYEIK